MVLNISERKRKRAKSASLQENERKLTSISRLWINAMSTNSSIENDKLRNHTNDRMGLK